MTKARSKFFLLIAICILVGCSNNEDESSPDHASLEIVDLLVADQIARVHQEWFDEELKEKMTLDTLQDSWEEYANTAGKFKEIKNLKQSNQGDNYTVMEAELMYTDFIFNVRMIFNDALKLVGFSLSEAVVNIQMPDSIVEEEIVVGAETSYPLEGLLTIPKERDGRIPAVVLVHGSGPSDRDESAYAYKTFRDLAWGLAQEGIAVIRYDKRTYTYGEDMVDMGGDFTVYEESVVDAIKATQLIKEDRRIDAEQVYIIGHSLGGMLAPRIDVQGGDYKGIIILAGSPRPLWEIVYDQNKVLLESVLNKSTKRKQEEIIKGELQKAQQLQKITDEQAEEVIVFGMGGYYLKEMNQYDVISIIEEIEKPLLIMQGEDDFQVFHDKDFAMWKEQLRDYEQVTFVSYPGLNHFFVHYEGLAKGTVGEYQVPKLLEKEVIEDIANWIWNNN